jgi:hypothetical protein
MTSREQQRAQVLTRLLVGEVARDDGGLARPTLDAPGEPRFRDVAWPWLGAAVVTSGKLERTAPAEDGSVLGEGDAGPAALGRMVEDDTFPTLDVDPPAAGEDRRRGWVDGAAHGIHEASVWLAASRVMTARHPEAVPAPDWSAVARRRRASGSPSTRRPSSTGPGTRASTTAPSPSWGWHRANRRATSCPMTLSRGHPNTHS